jgi:hypothetical protein
MNVRSVLMAILCLTTALTGCQTMRPVNLAGDQPIIAKLAPNDFVRVWMHDGRTLDLQVSAVEADALISGEQRIPLKDIDRLERRGISWTRTTLLILGIGALIVLGLAIEASHHVCALGNCQ